AMALLMRVRAIFRRIEFESVKYRPRQSELTFSSLTLDEAGRSILLSGEPIPLTPTEYGVLRHLMLHKGEAVSREELLNRVWGFESIVETRATDDTVRWLRQKLSGSGVVISAVWGYGFKLEEEQ
ncbi:MAG: response regulator transcription factor, partial [Clostridia bacterium]|nr:response regulator transcription factor [Clostridia bacterium]